MDDIFETFGQAIEDVVNNPILQISLRAIVVYAAVVWIAVAYWAFRDMRARTANLLLPYFAAGLIIAFTPIFFPFAVLVYRILRPTETIAEVYDRQLAAEAMEAALQRAAEDSARTLGPGRGLVGPGNLRAVGNTGPRPGPSKRIGAE
jgi:hypothetical protein